MITAQVEKPKGHKPLCEPPVKHSCGAPGQHNLLWWKWTHPGQPLKFATGDLHTSYNSIMVLHHKLTSSPDYDRLCPYCFNPSVFDHHCEKCGVEFNRVSAGRQVHDESSPVHRILERKGLGQRLSASDAMKIARAFNPHADAYMLNAIASDFLNQDRSVSKEDPLERAIKSKVLQVLKGFNPPDDVSDAAARLVEDFVKSMRQAFSELPKKPSWAIESGAKMVLGRLQMLYPHLRLDGRRGLPPHADDLNTLTPSDSIRPIEGDENNGDHGGEPSSSTEGEPEGDDGHE